MNREKAEKLLAALIFDDLDEASKAELMDYLETDDELRERLADMRMAVKVTSDALQHGSQPALDERRLNRLARLAGRSGRRPTVFTMRYMAAAAAIVAAIILPSILIFDGTGKLKPGLDLSGGGYAKLESGSKYDIEFIGGTSVVYETEALKEGETFGYFDSITDRKLASAKPPSPQSIDESQEYKKEIAQVIAPQEAPGSLGGAFASGVRGYDYDGDGGYAVNGGDSYGRNVGAGSGGALYSYHDSYHTDAVDATVNSDDFDTRQKESGRPVFVGTPRPTEKSYQDESHARMNVSGPGVTTINSNGSVLYGDGHFINGQIAYDSFSVTQKTEFGSGVDQTISGAIDRSMDGDSLIVDSLDSRASFDDGSITNKEFNFDLATGIEGIEVSGATIPADEQSGYFAAPRSSITAEVPLPAAQEKLRSMPPKTSPATAKPQLPQTKPVDGLDKSIEFAQSGRERGIGVTIESESERLDPLQKQKAGNKNDINSARYNADDLYAGYQVPAGDISKSASADHREKIIDIEGDDRVFETVGNGRGLTDNRQKGFSGDAKVYDADVAPSIRNSTRSLEESKEISDSSTKGGRSKPGEPGEVPILGDLPIAGGLFKSEAKKPLADVEQKAQVEELRTGEVSNLSKKLRQDMKTQREKAVADYTDRAFALQGEQREIQDEVDKQEIALKMDVPGSSIPYSEEINFPRNWKEISERREAAIEEEIDETVKIPVLGDISQTGGLFRPIVKKKIEGVEDGDGIVSTDGKKDKDAEIRPELGVELEESIKLGAIKLNSDTPVSEDEIDLPLASRFKTAPVNPWVMSERDPLSTFALDVDTASYTLCRRYINGGFLPPVGAVRMEEFINYFNYHYPQQADHTFTVHAEAAPSPFADKGKNQTLLKVGVKARTIGRDRLKAAHLVFVVDTSASMGQPDRLPLVQQALNLLIDRLSDADRVTLITCANESRLHLEATSVRQRDRIRQAINAIQPSGSTNLLAGLQLGYATARRSFSAKRINHIVLCSDGVANVGQTEADAVLKAVSEDRKKGITITCVGVGYGSYNDAFLESLANQGDGSYVFLDSSRQAQGVFVEQLAATMHVVAKDARIQVSFNPDRVRRYRLIGYENRDIEDKRFRDDTVDAGEVGSGQCSTALYELELTNQQSADQQGDLGTVFVRYRHADTGRMEEISQDIKSAIVQRREVEDSPGFFLAATASRFAEILRQSEHVRGGSLTDVFAVAEKVSHSLPLDRDVRELVELIRKAEHLPRAQ